MGIRTIVVDDWSGVELTEDVEPTKVTVDGTKYDLYLGSASKDAFVAWLSGEGDLPTKAAPVKVSAPKATRASGINNYGFDPKDVRAWAMANNIPNGDKEDAKAVGPVGKLAQYVYDTYKEAHN